MINTVLNVGPAFSTEIFVGFPINSIFLYLMQN